MAQHQDLIASVPLFAHLPVKTIDDLTKTAVERHYAPGDEIVTEGQAGVAFFVIGEGAVEVVHGCSRTRTSQLHAGDYFGEMALVDGRRRSATVRALTAVTCLALTRWDFMALVRSDAELAVGLLEEMSRRLRSLEAAGRTA
jgi:CRP/FNR family transcriptional regulator, cyclic AMP receptor protein